MPRYSLTFTRNLALVRAAVCRAQAVRVVKLIVDTGAAMTMLSWEILEGIGYAPAGTKERVRLVTVSGVELAPRITVERFHCLGAEVRDFPVVCHDLPFAHYADGLLGMDFLRRFDVAIRPRRGIIETP
jgi:predicted aspartyl protease